MTTFDILFLLSLVVGTALAVLTHWFGLGNQLSLLLILTLPVLSFLFMMLMAFYKWNPKHASPGTQDLNPAPEK